MRLPSIISLRILLQSISLPSWDSNQEPLCQSNPPLLIELNLALNFRSHFEQKYDFSSTKVVRQGRTNKVNEWDRKQKCLNYGCAMVGCSSQLPLASKKLVKYLFLLRFISYPQIILLVSNVALGNSASRGCARQHLVPTCIYQLRYTVVVSQASEFDAEK